MRTISAPQANMLVVSKSSRNNRRSMLGFAPNIGLSVVDYGRLEEIDNFYLECQDMRDYYRDAYNKLPRPEPFKKHYGKCGYRKVDRTTEFLMRPVKWVRQRQPIVHPIDYDRNLHLDEGIQIGRQHDLTSCIRYKR